ncbi:sideroflexin-4 isoform X1 [Girardinichthys multiradiatus]|uniref:sideroflexin-4 isoform X1 n=1 Tax=Girardinichthys multiradiatus TaxID=208333 RepID=UPI001FAD4201|nr:sideroflexin-4 isoform X1 [Girardinichthys multiradiatus]
MDNNLLQWKSRGQSFLSRLRTWFNLLDATLLLSSDAEILKAHALLGSKERLNEKDEAAVTLSLSSFHPDSGAALPLIFRPPAYFPISGPLVVASLLPHSAVKPALFWQFLLQSYNAGFNHMNRNTSAEEVKKTSLKHLLLIAGTVSYTTSVGALPQILINRLRVRSPPLQMFFRSILTIPLSAALAFFSVLTIRTEETEMGIQVFDYNGNPVGISKAAGEKAVWETGLSRAVLFGMTTAVPNLLVLLLQRTRFFQINSLLVAPCRHLSIALVFWLMIPVSFSFFSQVGTIKRESVEEELLAGAFGEELYYHRGL